jgi:hypothetical protein
MDFNGLPQTQTPPLTTLSPFTTPFTIHHPRFQAITEKEPQTLQQRISFVQTASPGVPLP